MATRRQRQVIHVALGSPACEVTAHWMQLQGVVSDEDDPCQPEMTHSRIGNTLVPRAVLVDSLPGLQVQPESHIVPQWDGAVERINLYEDNNPDFSDIIQQPFALPPDFTVPTIVPRSDPSAGLFSVNSNAPPRPWAATDSRHVDWDAEFGNEQKEEEDDYLNPRLSRPVQQQPTPATAASLASESEAGAGQTVPQSTDQATPRSSWLDVWRRIPYTNPKSVLASPVSTWQSDANTVTEEELLDRIRHQLEDCDSCQGVIVATSTSCAVNDGDVEQEQRSSSDWLLWSRFTSSVLETLQDECASAKRWVVSVSEANNNGETKQVPLYDLHRGLAFSEQCQGAHVVLPIHLRDTVSAAQTAVALEAVTLPYRLRDNSSSRRFQSNVALASYYSGTWSGEFPFGTTSSVSMHEYVNILLPSAHHAVLELDSLLWPRLLGDSSLKENLTAAQAPPKAILWQKLQLGTSVERRLQQQMGMRETSRPQRVEPGQWMEPVGANGGIMTNLSSSTDESDRRQSHQHFGLSSSLRVSSSMTQRQQQDSRMMPQKKSDSEDRTLADSLTCIMEGMGIGYRPEQSTATALYEDNESLTTNHKQDPVLAVLCNSTRAYPRIQSVVTGMEGCLQRRGISRTWFNREVAMGRLPQWDDCQEALSNCLELRDAYHPPGSRSEAPYEDF